MNLILYLAFAQKKINRLIMLIFAMNKNIYQVCLVYLLCCYFNKII